MRDFIMIFGRKINKIPEFYMISDRKMPEFEEFYMIIAGKIFSRFFFLGGGTRSPCPLVSYAYVPS